MSDQPVDASVERAVPVRVPPAPQPEAAAVEIPPFGYYHPFPLAHRKPRVVVKADLLPAVSVGSLVMLLGLPLGWLWSRLAPAENILVVQGGKLIPVPLESYHRFDDLVLFVLLGLGAGLVTGVAIWLLRERRGPVVMLAAIAGSLGAAWLMKGVGVAWAGGRYAVTAAPKIGDVVPNAPVLESAWVLIAWPMAAALAYGALAAWNGMDDLGRRLS
ncbi:DUF2567 domain-containing protein [Solihabitans fulvus]|uniref:DUF2567 domain-containing protein n=1 Tax=Solihabitans fulvus TaxID=1892852 RepID=UPI003F66B283